MFEEIYIPHRFIVQSKTFLKRAKTRSTKQQLFISETDLLDITRLISVINLIENINQPRMAIEYSADQLTHDVNVA